MSGKKIGQQHHFGFAVMVLLALGCAALANWALKEAARDTAFPVPAPALPSIDLKIRPRYRPVAYDRLPGWEQEDLSTFWAAFNRSCSRWARRPEENEVPVGDHRGAAGQWMKACTSVAETGYSRKGIENAFQPFQISDHLRVEGLFTGYFEAHLRGSRVRDESFRFPLYKRPPELVDVDLGRFRERLKGQRLAGVVQGNRLVPFYDRKAIDQGALNNDRLEIAWVDDPIALFFLHIQGSGRLTLRDGREMRVGYAAQNGHPYFAVGRELIRSGEVAAEDMSLQAIRSWLLDHSDRADALMQLNASYVFFRELRGPGPVGSEGVALTPRRSLAVDRRYIPLGTPVWFAGEVPAMESGSESWQRLFMAQDTGGAIQGVVRGDVFWGFGDEAENRAGRMKHQGRLWVLLPRGLDPSLPAS